MKIHIELLLVLLLGGCALTEGRQHAADCSRRQAKLIRQEILAIPAAPEFKALEPVVASIVKRASSIEKWSGISQEDHKRPPVQLPLCSEDEQVEQLEYQGAVQAKNAIIDLIPRLPTIPDGSFPGLALGGGAGIITTLLGIGKLFMDKRRVTKQRDEHRAAADDLECAVDEIRNTAGNGGLDDNKFKEIMADKKAGKRHHARKKLAKAEEEA